MAMKARKLAGELAGELVGELAGELAGEMRPFDVVMANQKPLGVNGQGRTMGECGDQIDGVVCGLFRLSRQPQHHGPCASFVFVGSCAAVSCHLR